MTIKNPFDDMPEIPQGGKKDRKSSKSGSKKPEYQPAITGLDRTKVAKAAKKKTMEGQYWKRTMRLPPEFQEMIQDIYTQEVMASSIAEIERWVMAMGLKAYFDEGKRPDYNQKVRREINMPIIGSDGDSE